MPRLGHGFTGTPRSFFAPHRDVSQLEEVRRKESWQMFIAGDVRINKPPFPATKILADAIMSDFKTKFTGKNKRSTIGEEECVTCTFTPAIYGWFSDIETAATADPADFFLVVCHPYHSNDDPCYDTDDFESAVYINLFLDSFAGTDFGSMWDGFVVFAPDGALVERIELNMGKDCFCTMFYPFRGHRNDATRWFLKPEYLWDVVRKDKLQNRLSGLILLLNSVSWRICQTLEQNTFVMSE